MNKVSWIITITVFISIVIVFVFSFTTKPKIEINIYDDNFTIKTIAVDEQIEYKDIDKINITEEEIEREKVFGFDNAKVNCGKYSNEKMGEFLCYINNKIDLKIVIEYNDKYLILNKQTNEDTQELYTQLLLRKGE